MNTVRLLVGALALLVVPSAVVALEIGPDTPWCAAAQSLPAGDELVLRPGEYAGPCGIRRGGTAEHPLVIRAADPARRPHIVYTGTDANVVDIWADHVTLRGLRFGPTVGYVDAVRIKAHRGITVEDCEFNEIAALTIVANHTNVAGLTVRGNVVRDSRATAFYFGCHDGAQCELTDVLVEGNVIIRAGTHAEGVGYGLQLKLNTTGIVRDNVIVETKGPGIMVYGSRRPDRTTVVERNFVAGSRQSSAIVVGGGPAVVRNNVAGASSEAGIGLEDYNVRGLLRDVVVVGNTVYDGGRAGIAVPETARGVVIANNAVHARAAALPEPRDGLTLLGNVDCSADAGLCFTDPGARDFSPGPLLRGAGVAPPEPWVPTDDYAGRPRPTPPSAGALEGAAGPIPLDAKVRR